MIRSGLLAPNAHRLTPSVGKGVNETWKGRFLLLDGSSVEGYAKFISGPQMVNELLVNILARLVGLNVTEPFLVRVDKVDYPHEFAALGITAEEYLTFGTRTLPGGSLARHWQNEGLNSAFINTLLDKTHEWKRVAAFDTWVGNIDRHFHNLFYDGSRNGELWLLDHGHCFGGPQWTESDLMPELDYSNRLLDDLHTAGYLSALRRQSLISETPKMESISALVDLDGAIDDSFVRSLTPASTALKLVEYLHTRRERLTKMVAHKVGMPLLDFDIS